MLQSDKALPNWLLVTLLITWICATLVGLWWFQQSKLRPFISPTDNTAYFQAKHIDEVIQPYLQQLPAPLPGQQTLVHFWKPDCLCNRVSQRHFSGLLDTFKQQQLRVLVIAHPDSSEQQRQELQSLNGSRFTVIKAESELLDIPASPALALYSPQQRLGYYGPYGFGAFCTVREDGFLSGIVTRMQQKEAPSFINVVGDGCFCSWGSAQLNASSAF